jgi:hypothetical protein
MSQGVLTRLDLLASLLSTMNGLLLTVAPSGPQELGSLAPVKPLLPRFAFGWQSHLNDGVVEVLSSMMVDCRSKVLQVASCTPCSPSLLYKPGAESSVHFTELMSAEEFI